jgi:hypothetical protein
VLPLWWWPEFNGQVDSSAALMRPPFFCCGGAITALCRPSLNVGDELLGRLALVDQPVPYLGFDLFDYVDRNIEAVVGAQIGVIPQLRCDLLNNRALETKSVLVE